MPYTDDLDPEEQIGAEEAIAGYIFDASWHDRDTCPERLHEETCALLGRVILHDILCRFRPDLIATTQEED